MERAAILTLVLVFFVSEARGATVEPFRRDVGHPQWHHGTFQDVSAKVKSEAHHLLHSRARVPFHVPLEVSIVLVGFNGDGGYRFSFDSRAFQWFMKKTFPTHKPACLETGMPLDIEHDVYYTVIPVGQPELITLEWEMRQNMVPVGTARENEWGREIPLYEVEATRLEPTFDRLYNFLFNFDSTTTDKSYMNEPVPYAIFVTNFDKVRMDPKQENNSTLEELLASKISPIAPDQLFQQEGGYVYRHRYNGGAETQVWLSSGRYAVIDLSAGPCVYGKIESEEGSVGYRTIPRFHNLLFPRRREPVDPKDIEQTFRGLLSNLVVSAIEHVVSPDVRFDFVDPTMRLLVPVIVFSNHRQYNPMQQGTNFSIDMQRIETEVKRLVPPGQDAVVVGGVHDLHDHEKLAIAVVKAIRSHSVHETRRDGRFHARTKTYLDGALLNEEMRHSTDVLAAGLLEASDPNLLSRYFRKDNAARKPGGGFGSGYVDGEDEDSVIQSRSARWGTLYLTKMKELKKKGSPKKTKGKRPVEKSYGTRVLPVFVLSLAGVDAELLMEGDSLMMASYDAVFVLQHNNNSVPTNYVSGTKRRMEDANSPMRHIIAGLGSVIGGLAAPYEKASHIHGRPMHNWLWGSGHHPFGPFTNTSSISQLLVDTSVRNAIYARVDMALRKIRDANEKIQSFSSEYLHTPLGEKIKSTPKASKVELWLDVFYKKTAVLPLPLPQDSIDRLETYLDGLEDQLVNLASLLYNHRLNDAFRNATSVVRSAMFTQDYVDHVLHREKGNMKCCKVVYETPVQSSQTFVYAGILVAGFLVYFLVIYFSAPER